MMTYTGYTPRQVPRLMARWDDLNAASVDAFLYGGDSGPVPVPEPSEAPVTLPPGTPPPPVLPPLDPPPEVPTRPVQEPPTYKPAVR